MELPHVLSVVLDNAEDNNSEANWRLVIIFKSRR